MNRRFVAAVIGLAFFLAPNLARAQSDWPQFRGPGGQGISKDKGVPLKWGPNENMLWKVDLPGPGASSPIIFRDRVYVTCYSGKGQALELMLHAMDRNTGKTIWTKRISPRLPEQPNMREGHGYASSTPAADSSGIYCYFGKSGAVAFDFDGNLRWRSPLGDNLHGWGSASSPVIHGDNVIINAGVESSTIFALNKQTGKEVWRAPGNKEDGWNTPIVVPLKDGKTELAIALGGKVHGIDPATGKQNWFSRTDIGWYMVPGMVHNDGIIYTLGGRSGITSLAVRAGGQGDVTRTHRLWTSTKGSNVSSPIYHEGHLYWMNDALGTACCAVAATGKIVYEERTGANQVYASPVMAEGRIYYVARGGKTYVLPATPRYEILATNDIGEQRIMFNSSPAIAGSRIYLRTDRALYCIGTK